MEAIIVLVLIALGFVVIGSIMGMTASGRISTLEQQNRNLNERVKRLEGGQSETDTPQSVASSVSEPAPNSKPKRKPIPEIGLQSPRVAALTTAPVKTSEDGASASPPSWSPSAFLKSHKPKKPSRNLEEIIGGQWSVWVGGLALLIGAVLLIRFSIEAGFFGPGARILMALVLGCVLLAAGEWLKRSDDKVLKGKLGEAAKALQDNASVPGLLSAVGIFTLLGTTYAAHELYGFISAPVAFIALGVIALGAMALSLRQGPLLAAIGLLASMVTPLLIQTETPNFMALVGYLLVIGFAALALARRTNWRWLETGTVFGWLFWLYMSVAAAMSGQLILWSFFLAVGFGATVWLSDKQGPERAGDLTEVDLNPTLSVVWGGLAAMLIGYIVVQGHTNSDGFGLPEMALAVSSILALCVTAVVMKRQCGHLVIAGLLAVALGLFDGPKCTVDFIWHRDGSSGCAVHSRSFGTRCLCPHKTTGCFLACFLGWLGSLRSFPI